MHQKNRKQWIQNQYPEKWSDKLVFEPPNKITAKRQDHGKEAAKR